LNKPPRNLQNKINKKCVRAHDSLVPGVGCITFKFQTDFILIINETRRDKQVLWVAHAATQMDNDVFIRETVQFYLWYFYDSLNVSDVAGW